MDLRYEALFRKADTQKKGTITFDEFHQTMRNGGYRGSKNALKNMFRSANTAGDGQLSLDEFMIAMGDRPETNQKEAMMRRVFNLFDKDGDGQIDRDDLRAVFNDMGWPKTDYELTRLIQLVDRSNSGTVDYKEFIKRIYNV